MFSTVDSVSPTDQQANFSEIQELLQKAQERVKYFFDINIDLDIISEWVKNYNECLNQINQQKQMNQDIQKNQYITSTLQNLINNIEIIKTEGLLLVGNFKPWMSGVGMINFPYGFTLYGKITFGILNGYGVIEKNQKNIRFIGTFNKNKLQGEGTIIFNNQYKIKGLFDKGRIISGPIQIQFLNEPQKEISANLNIDANQIELSNQQQIKEIIQLNDFQYIRPQNIKYKASQFVLGQKNQSSYALYENEQIKQEYRNGMLYNGVGQVLTSSNILLNGTIIDGALWGQGILEDQNKNLLLEGEFSNNILRKGKKYYLQSKILYEEGVFNEQMELSGNGTKYFDIAGLIQEVGIFQNGQLHGEGIRYQRIDGQGNQIKEQGHFENGILISGTKFHQNGKIKEKGNFNQNGLVGEGERRHFNGYIQEYGIFEDGQLHTLIEKSGRANDNGVIIEIGYFLQGRLEGEGDRYYPNGKKKEIGSFTKGLLNGLGKKYYNNEDNSLQEEGQFKDGKLHSQQVISKQYYENGSFRCSGLFENGQLTASDGCLYFNEYEMKGVFLNGQVNGTMRILNSITGQEFRKDNIVGNKAFLEAANQAKVYLSTQFNTNAQSSYKR